MVEYLNVVGSDKCLAYYSGDFIWVLVFQLEGSNMLVGLKSSIQGFWDVLVVINFGRDMLFIKQEFNMFNIKNGDYFIDVIDYVIMLKVIFVYFDFMDVLFLVVVFEVFFWFYVIWVQGRV